MQRHGEKVEMKVITAQVSLYPLRKASIGPAIRGAVRAFDNCGLNSRVGEMSTLVWGEEGAVFQALRAAFDEATKRGDTAMVVTLSNACPEPG